MRAAAKNGPEVKIRPLNVVMTNGLAPERCACGVMIVWALTPNLYRWPVEVDRCEDGTLLVYRETLIGELVGPHRLRKATDDDRRWLHGRLWRRHTCPAVTP